MQISPIILSLCAIFVVKVVENILDATKIILLQKSRIVLSGIAVTLVAEISYHITRLIVNADGDITLHVAAIAAGIGYILAGAIKVRHVSNPYFEIIRSKDMDEIKEAHAFLDNEHIKHDVIVCMNRELTGTCYVIYASPSSPKEKVKIAEFVKQSNIKFNHTVID